MAAPLIIPDQKRATEADDWRLIEQLVKALILESNLFYLDNDDLSGQQKQAHKEYRKKLRDLKKDSPSDKEVAWPPSPV